MFVQKDCLILIVLVPVLFAFKADSSDSMTYKGKRSYSKLNSAANALKKSYASNDEKSAAINYETIANELIIKKEYAKAETYLKKAAAIYSKLKLKAENERVLRNLAKIQESQKKFKDAIETYNSVSAKSTSPIQQEINANDANRLISRNAPALQDSFVSTNIRLYKKEEKKEEIAFGYTQKAENSLLQNKKSAAVNYYQQAIDFSKNNPEKQIELKNNIAKIYENSNQLDSAININKAIITTAKEQQDYKTQINQLQSVAAIYFKKKDSEKAIAALKEAYVIASKNGHSIDAKNSLVQLITFYQKIGDTKSSVELYENFIKNFEQLIQSDSSLIDSKTFQETEDKINQLEQEKKLKDELISKKNTFNYFLMGFVGVLLLLFYFIIKALIAIKTKNKKIALQSLRREMNPHFIFNSLNSVNQYISENKELEANKYLNSYSLLMRNMMENSNKDFITIANEIEQLKKYLNLEHLRFQDKFDYRIEIADQIDPDSTMIPNMILQPYLENAIWHGLRYLEGKGTLLLSVNLINQQIVIQINDTGIGLAKSLELKTAFQKVHQSRGVNNTKERIDLLNDLYKTHIEIALKNKELPEQGTLVSITFPIINKK